MNKTKDALHKSPRKKRAVIKRQASNFCVSMTWPHKQSRMTRTTKETVDLVNNFCERDDVSRIIPGNRDVGTVKNVNGRAKHRKRHEHRGIHAMFKEEHPNVKIESSRFAELRPLYVLLSSVTGSC